MYNAWKNTWIFSANQTPHRYVSRSNFVYILLHLNLSSKKFEDNIRYCISLMNPLRSILHIINWMLAATFFVSLVLYEFCFRIVRRQIDGHAVPNVSCFGKLYPPQKILRNPYIFVQLSLKLLYTKGFILKLWVLHFITFKAHTKAVICCLNTRGTHCT